MRFPETALAVLALLASCALSAQAADQPSPTAASADQLFQAGKFTQAAWQYAQLAAANPNDYHATLQLGAIALLANHLTDAETWLKQAAALQPAETTPRVMLAEAYYRSDDFQSAVTWLNGIDTATNPLVLSQYPTLNTAKLESFAGQTPYAIEGSGDKTVLQLLRTDPLPLVSVRVNGGPEVTFFIDTGGSEVLLDTDFARELGTPIFGTTQGTFSGGQQAPVQQTRIDSLTLGDWTVRNLPAVTLSVRPLSSDLGAQQIDGIIGTTLFYHFLTTLDVPHGQLILRRKDSQTLHDFLATAAGSTAVPIWMASDHFMVGWGRIESLPPTRLFVDTGLTGAGVKLAESVIQQAGITLEEDKATTGAGGGGTLTTVPYVVHHVSFGKVQEQNVPGLYDGPFPWENTFGFHLAGMLGHDFFSPYTVTFDYQDMKIYLQK